MKSQVGLGRLYPDGRLDHAQDTLKEQATESSQEASPHSAPEACEMVSVVVHVEKAAIDELLQKTSS